MATPLTTSADATMMATATGQTRRGRGASTASTAGSLPPSTTRNRGEGGARLTAVSLRYVGCAAPGGPAALVAAEEPLGGLRPRLGRCRTGPPPESSPARCGWHRLRR